MLSITGIRCPKCGDVIYSRSRHDLHRCSCKAVAIDGGFDYVRVLAANDIDFDSIEYLKFDLQVTRRELFQDWDSHENTYGRIPKEEQGDMTFYAPSEAKGISAHIHTDDYRAEANFNAIAWFEQASDEEIKGVIDEDYGGGYATDHVAEWFQGKSSYVDEFFETFENSESPHGEDYSGFSVRIDEDEAVEWIEKNRPHLLEEKD